MKICDALYDIPLNFVYQDLLNRTQISVPLCVKCPSGEFVTSWSGKAPSAASDDELIIYIDRVFACQYNIEDGSSVSMNI